MGWDTAGECAAILLNGLALGTSAVNLTASARTLGKMLKEDNVAGAVKGGINTVKGGAQTLWADNHDSVLVGNKGSSEAIKTDFIVSPNSVAVDAGISIDFIPKAAVYRQKLQHEFSHASDFGISGNWNKLKATEYQQAIQNDINNAKDIYISKYRGTDVYVYFNSNTQVGAYVDYRGAYIGGWKFTQSQIDYHMNNGIKLQ